MLVHGTDDRLLLLRKGFSDGGPSWVEEIDPLTLEVRRRSPDLALGPFWPGGFAAFADGSTVVVQGAHAHRLDASLAIVASVRLPAEAPYNSFVVLADGSIATKDLQFPGAAPSQLSILDPITLTARCAPFELPEPSVARISASGNGIVVVGVTSVHRLRWDPASATIAPTVAPARYLVHEGQSYGWDPVIADDTVWWLDNGDHTFPNGLTMLGNGVAPGPVRLWRLRGDELASVEVCGRPAGAVSNPPLVDPARGLVVGYDSANGVLAAFDTASLEQRWSTELNTAQHLMLFPATGELIADDHDRATGDGLAVVDIATGEVTVRAPIGSPAQSVVFGAPGLHDDVYYVSLSTIARIELDPR